MSELRLTYIADDDENRLGTLVVLAQSGGFAGRAESYVALDPLLKFVDDLGTYPVNAGTGITYYTGVIEDEVRISVTPLTSRGHLKVTVELRHRRWWEDRQLPQVATLQMATDYAALETFQRELSRLGLEEQVEAVLAGTA